MEMENDKINLYGQLQEATAFLRSKGVEDVQAGLVLGSGLDGLLDHIEAIETIPYRHIPHFPKVSVEPHKGNLIYGRIGAVKVLAMQNRFHYYEGYTMQQITFPVRLMKASGATCILLNNAAGGMNPDYKKGDLVLLTDHINLLPDNPLRGIDDPSIGPRFVDMSCPYDKSLNETLKTESRKQGIELKEGIYVAVSGPNLETRAEYRYLRAIGADMVGMSTVPEVLVANQIKLPCAAVSVITDECDPNNLQPVDIEDILATANIANKKLSAIFRNIIQALEY